jgi:hypothetical protein
MCGAADADFQSEDVLAAAQMVLPEVVANHHHALCCRGFILCQQISTTQRRNFERAECIGRDRISLQTLGLAVETQCLATPDSGTVGANRLEGCTLLPEREKLIVGQEVLVGRTAEVLDAIQAGGIGIGERSEDCRFDKPE